MEGRQQRRGGSRPAKAAGARPIGAGRIGALAKQDIVLPAGDQKIGSIDFLVETNAQPVDVATFNSLPIKQVGNTVVTVGDVAHVHPRRAAANQCRAGARTPGGLLEVLKGRRCVDSGDRGRSESEDTRDRTDIAARREDHGTERRLDLREPRSRTSLQEMVTAAC
jgi:hypothetical protein